MRQRDTETSICYLGHVRIDAVGVVGPRAGGAVDEIGSLLFSTHEAVLLSSGLVDALIAVPAFKTVNKHQQPTQW